MPPPAARPVSNLSTAATAYTLATEVLSGAAINPSLADPAQVVRLIGIIVATTGVGATTFTPRIRRGGLAGTLVGAAAAVTTPASSTVVLIVAGDDAPGDVASVNYVLTGTAAGVAATGVFAYLFAIVG
jgi:hypothetical protein